MFCIIDDDKQTAEMLGEFARLAGYEARTFVQARDFFSDEIASKEVELLVLDLNMPEMDGVEVMRRLALKDHAPPIILISGYDKGVLHSAEYLAHEHHLEIVASLNKPISMTGFQELLKSYISDHPKKNVYKQGQGYSITASEIEEALLEQQFIVHYQPQINIRTGSLHGMEALVRWQHPRHGLIYPVEFIDVAEKNGLMSDLTAQIIKQVVHQTALWHKEDFISPVSVNVSAGNITSLILPEQLSNLLSQYKLDPEMLTLEITEGVLMGELSTSLDILTRLRIRGIKLSIDDFGTGYSSLSLLHRVPFSELKIDKSFVMKMELEHEARAIVKTCIMLGHELNMKVVAEGVESIEAMDILMSYGCDIAQGYFISKPMPANDLLMWSKDRVLGKDIKIDQMANS